MIFHLRGQFLTQRDLTLDQAVRLDLDGLVVAMLRLLLFVLRLIVVALLQLELDGS